MLPMNVDLIDTLIFERQYEIQRQFQHLALTGATPHPLLARLKGSLVRLLASRTPSASAATTPPVAPVSMDRPAGVVLMATPAEPESLDRAA